MLVFLDLETTGLHSKYDSVLEVAAVVMPDDILRYTETRRLTAPTFTAVVKWSAEPTTPAVNPYVVSMHAKNGLWIEALKSVRTITDVDAELAAFLIANGCGGGERAGAQLAGNSIHFDRAFMSEHMPSSLAQLHYRQLDVSSINELASRVWPAAHKARPRGPNGDPAHRALADVYESISVVSHYAARLIDYAASTGAYCKTAGEVSR